MSDDDFTAIGPDLPDPLRLVIRETTSSTNDDARALAEAGAPDGRVVLALRQTEGRGRRGAAWFSPPGEALAFSVLVRPQEPKALWPRLALAAGLAVAEALEAHTPLVGIKWPNDVWAGGKKIAGILVEAGRDFVIVGIGLNVNTASFPPEISEIATSLAIATGSRHSRPQVLAEVLKRFEIRRHQIGAEFESLVRAVSLRCVLTGHAVRLNTSAGPKQGVVEGIAPGGELLLRTPHGLERLLQADDVRLIS